MSEFFKHKNAFVLAFEGNRTGGAVGMLTVTANSRAFFHLRK
jgi:hypothetical protein